MGGRGAGPEREGQSVSIQRGVRGEQSKMPGAGVCVCGGLMRQCRQPGRKRQRLVGEGRKGAVGGVGRGGEMNFCTLEGNSLVALGHARCLPYSYLL